VGTRDEGMRRAKVQDIQGLSAPLEERVLPVTLTNEILDSYPLVCDLSAQPWPRHPSGCNTWVSHNYPHCGDVDIKCLAQRGGVTVLEQSTAVAIIIRLWI
jgi:hypothetical protein